MGMDDDKLAEGPTLNQAEVKFLKQVIINVSLIRDVQGIDEWLGHLADEHTDWYDDMLTETAEKLGLTPEETWRGRE